MNTSGTEGLEKPRDPGSGEKRVRMQSLRLKADVLGKVPTIFVEDEPVEDPACFWIDREHVYFRINWATWAAVTVGDSDRAAAHCGSKRCGVAFTGKRSMGHFSAPVYHIAALPEELFDEGSDCPERYRQCLLKLLQAVESLPRNVGVYEHVKFGNDSPTFVIKDDRRTLILDALPEGVDSIVFAPARGGEEHGRLEDEWQKGLVSLKFIERLKRMRRFVAGMEPDSIVHLGFLADSRAMEKLRDAARPGEITGIRLFTYEDLEAELADLFSPEDS